MIRIRPRRLRKTKTLRHMVRETRMDKAALIYPVFVMEGENKKEEIAAMPGQYRCSVDRLGEVMQELMETGICSVMLFGIPQHKDPMGSGAWEEKGVVQRAVESIKRDFPRMYVICDVCMCEYTSHGHCGILKGLEVDNDQTLGCLAKIAVSYARAGADMVAPSDMMDGRVGAIRQALDGAGFSEVPIMAYSAKYASAFYGPFREAADSAPAFGDRRGYQMDIHNKREALREIRLDMEEGADIVMVKPGLCFLDIVSEARKITPLPLAVYSVSGEYAMVKAAAQRGWIDEERILCELAVGAFRAGADLYISYYAKEIAKCMDRGLIG